MNQGKVGAPFQYGDSYIQFLAFLKIGFKIPYRTAQGIVRGLSDYVKIEEEMHLSSPKDVQHERMRFSLSKSLDWNYGSS